MDPLQYVVPVIVSIALGFVILTVTLATRLRRTRQTSTIAAREAANRISELEERLAPILDLDAELARVAAEIDAEQARQDQLRAAYQEKKGVYDQLIKQVAVFDETLAFAEMGVYAPHFDFTDSESYKTAVNLVREEQKALISAKTAVICTTKWSIDGSASKGQTMTGRNIRLTLRAFNNECDAAISNARWNNVNAMEKRITNAAEQIDKLNASNAIFVTVPYVQLKLRELFLTHEYREKLKAERDERADAARAAREEQKLLRDMEQAEAEEDRYQRLLKKARDEAQSIVGPQLEAFNEQIRMLERDLEAAHKRVERAQAMAEKTRSGYVYVISNIGSFGDDIVKIGLTRRLDPEDRIRELGDASVPFIFDTHAIIYSDNAPSLERALHSEFEPVRVNSQNYRKEFFRANLDEVEAAVRRLAPTAPFFKDIDAQEYRETLAKRSAVLLAVDTAGLVAFPTAI